MASSTSSSSSSSSDDEPSAALTPQGSITITNEATGTTTSVNMTQSLSVVDSTSVFILSPGNVRLTVGGLIPETIQFAGLNSIFATNNFSHVNFVADGGNNTFKTMGGMTDVVGGPGRNTYDYHAGALVIEDYKVGTDHIRLPLFLSRGARIGSDGAGGTLVGFSFPTGGVIDVVGVDPSAFRF